MLRTAFTSTNIPAQLESTGLVWNYSKRPDGRPIIPWTIGQSLVWDFTRLNNFAHSNIKQTKEYAGTAAELAVKRKKNPNILK